MKPPELEFAQKKAADLLQANGMTKMTTWAGDGPMTFRVASLGGGVLMVLFGFIGFLGKFFSLAIIQVRISEVPCVELTTTGFEGRSGNSCSHGVVVSRARRSAAAVPPFARRLCLSTPFSSALSW